MMEMFDVFISYRRSDGQEVAEELYKYLTAKGLRVFLDKEKLEKGATFPEQLREKLLMAPNYILIATNDVFQFREGKDWVREEIEIAVREYKAHPIDRTITTLVFKDTVFPDTDELPLCVRGIEDVERVVASIDLSEINVHSDEMKKAFKTIFGVATKITSANLWNAAHRWLENSKKEKSRFSNLNICESILPNVGTHIEKADIPILVHSQNSTEETKPLYEAIMESEGHLYLIGQGGIGKTTALMHIMNQAYAKGRYQEGNQIPIYVELSFAPDSFGALYKTEVSSFIRRSVYRQIRTDLKVKQVAFSAVDELDEIFTIEPEVAVNPVTDIFSKSTPAPEYLLLLDGLNEVSTVRLPECDKTIFQMVSEEIQYLMDECPNVRVVLTSRFDETDINGKQVTRLQLKGVENDVIRQYLLDNHVSEKKIEKIYEDKNLLETLRIPLFLTMYIYLEEDNEAVTQGEILRLFFSERRRNLDLYTNQDRLEMLEKNVSSASSAIQLNRVTSEMYYFMLDFILPEIAWQMEKDGLFYLSSRQIRKLLEPVLSNDDDLSVCGEFGSEVFLKYRAKGKANLHVDKIAKKMRKILGEGDEDSFRTITENILTCCVLTLGVLQENNQRYGFVHQHIRDYFAAVKNINTMKLALYMYEEEEKELALECMNQAFHKEPVSLNVRKFIGEYLGEHKNKPYYDENEQIHYGVPEGDEDRNQIDRVLNIYRGYFDDEVGYGLFTLIKILCEIRSSLAGGDYAQLDLSRCALNDSGLGMYGLITNLNHTKINPDTLFFTGHKEEVDLVHYTSDGKKILSYGKDGSVCVWDAKNGEIIKGIKTKSIVSRWLNSSRVFFIEDGKKILFVDYQNTEESICVWNINTEKQEKKVALNNKFKGTIVSADEKQILLWTDTQVYTWSFETEELEMVYQFSKPMIVEKCAYLAEGKEIFVFYRWTDYTQKEENPSYEYESINAIFADLGISTGGKIRTAIKVIDVKTKQVRDEEWCEKNELLEIGTFQNKMYQLVMDGDCSVKCRKDDDSQMVTISHIRKKWEQDLHYVVQFSDTGKWFVVIDEYSLRLFDTKTFQHVKTITYQYYFRGISFNDACDKFVVYTRDGEILVYDTNYFEIVLKMESACASFVDMRYLQQGNQLLTYCDDGVLSTWNINDKRLIYRKKGLVGGVAEMRYNKYKNQISLSEFTLSRVYELPNFKELFSCSDYGRFSKDGKYYYNDCMKDVGYIYDTDTYALVFETKGIILAIIGDYAIVHKFYPSKNVIYDIQSRSIMMELDNPGGEVNFFMDEKDIVSIIDEKDFMVISYDNEDQHFIDKKTFQYITKEDYAYNSENTIYERNKEILDTYKKNDNMYLEYESSFFSEERSYGIHDKLTDEELWKLDVGYHLHKYEFHESKDEVAILSQREKIEIFELHQNEDYRIVEKKWEILHETGLDVMGLDLRNLHPDSVFSDEQKELLRSYGAYI